MANTATAQTGLNIRIGGNGPVVPYICSFDTTGQDLTIVTPASGKMAAVVGMFMSEANAVNVTFKSGSTTLWVPEFAANQAVYDKLGNGASVITQPGEALVIQVSAAVSSMLLYVVQGAFFDFQAH